MTTARYAPVLPSTGSFVLTGAPDDGALADAGFVAQRVGALHVFARSTSTRQGGDAWRSPVGVGRDWCTASTGTLGDLPLYIGEARIECGRWVLANDRFAAAGILRAWAEADGEALDPVEAVERVRQLPSGTLARWACVDGRWRTERYARPLPWRPERPAEAPEAAASRVLAELQDAVTRWASTRRQPVVLLSGGVDSGLVAAFAHAANPQSVALTLTTPWGGELERAAATAEHIGIRLETVGLSEEQLCSRIEETQVWLQRGEPELCLVQLMICEARRIAGEFGDLLLTGMGSDLLNAPNDVGMDTSKLSNDGGNPLAQLVDRVRSAAETGLFFSGRWHPHHADGLPIAFPFWEDATVHAQLSVPPELKAADGYEKHYLRRLAEAFLPHETAWGRKYAIHEGSGLAVNLARALVRRHPALGDEPLAAMWAQTARRHLGGAALALSH